MWNKLKAIIDFACYLRDRDEVEELLRMQRSSKFVKLMTA